MSSLVDVLSAAKVLAVTFVLMIFLDTLGAIQTLGKVQLPSPRRYLATFLLWGILGLVAGLHPRAARASSQLSILVTLTALVLGQGGRTAAKLTGFLDRTANAAAEGSTP